MKKSKKMLITLMILLLINLIGFIPKNLLDNSETNSNFQDGPTPTLSNGDQILLHTYDFEDQTLGQDPTYETFIINEGSGDVYIDDFGDVQHKHMALHKVGTTGRVFVKDYFSLQGETYGSGEYHLKVYHDNSGFGINMNSANGECILAMVWWNGEIKDDLGGTFLANYALNQWLDVIIYFDLNVGWMFDLNGVRYGAGYNFPFFGAFTANAEHIWMTSFISGGGDGYFRVDDISAFYDSISVVTPLNQTYTSAISGYYPATFGFEDERDGTFGTDIRFVDNFDWSDPTDVVILDELDGHKKVLKVEEPGSGWDAVDNNFPNQTFGTIEFWARVDDATEDHPLGLFDGPEVILDLRVLNDNFQWRDNLDVWHDVKACLDDTWYHWRIDFRGDDTFDLYIDGMKEIDNQNLTNNMINGINQIIFRDRDTAAILYIDAVGYSWDPNYHIGDNFYEGLLVSYIPQTPLTRMSYSLDNQEKISIFGNTTILMPEDGQHTLQIFGKNSDGVEYQSNVRFFTVDFPIDIITPEAKTYIGPMSGYYPATYGFEETITGTLPSYCDYAPGGTNPDGPGSYARVIDDWTDGAGNLHKKVLKTYDRTSSGTVHSSLNFTNEGSEIYRNSTIEFWACNTNTGNFYHTYFEILGDLGGMVVFEWDSGGTPNDPEIRITPGTGEFGTGVYHEWNRWYRYSIDISCDGGYAGLASNQFRFRIYNETGDLIYLSADLDLKTTHTTGGPYKYHVLSTQSQSDVSHYLDGFGVKNLQSNYKIGDNLNEGLLLSYENSTTFDWIGYSLDGQTNITIIGNTTIPLPKDGPHSIRVYGNNSLGEIYESNVRYFSVYHISIITPENKIYNEPMSGYYPATYGFENDIDGAVAKDWWGQAIVESSYDGHNKVIKHTTYDWNPIGVSLDNQTSGTIEFYFNTNNTNKDVQFNCFGYDPSKDSTRPIILGVNNGNFRRFGISGWEPLDIPMSCSANTWYHVSIDFDCGSDTWNTTINGVLKSWDDPFLEGDSTYISDLKLYQFDIPVITRFDAIGLSWDSNYEIGDNWKEGLLLSYENSTVLNWKGYSLDAQSIKTILGNTTIPLPEDGSRSIRVFGNDTLGNMYTSDDRYFSINTGSFFNITTPKNKTYFASISGYYPATYGFENDEPGNVPEEWLPHTKAGTINMIPELDSHSNVVEFFDNTNGQVYIYQKSKFKEEYGTVEYWIRTTDVSRWIGMHMRSGGGSILALRFNLYNSKWQYNNGTDKLISAFDGVYDPENDRWYHIALHFECRNGYDEDGYQGLSSDTWKVIIDNTYESEEISFGSDVPNLDYIGFFSENNNPAYYYYVDAIGYSWDPYYEIGDNLYNGLHLGFTQNTELNWLGYSLDGQNNITIMGNTTIPFIDLTEGIHKIQVFGEDSRGILYESEIRYFTVDYEINIITPEDKTYIEPMNGYYPATYGFENDENNNFPNEWFDSSGQYGYAKVIGGTGGHNKVLECYSGTEDGSRIDSSNFFDPQEYGSFEFWWYKSSSYTSAAIVDFWGETPGVCISIRVDHWPSENNNKIEYSNATGYQDTGYPYYADNKWMHFRIDFNCSSDTYSLWIDQVKYLDNIDFINSKNETGVNQIRFDSYNAGNAVLYYVDALGYSWDPNYNIGDNINEGLLLSYENSTNLDWQGYILDGQPIKTILGNTTIQMPLEGDHLIHILANDSLGEIYQSELRHFGVYALNIITPENKTYTKPMNGYYPGTYGFENDLDGSIPSGWTDLSGGAATTMIDGEKFNHKKVLKAYDPGSGSWTNTNITFSPQISGTIEFWVLKESGGDGSPCDFNLRGDNKSAGYSDAVRLLIDDSNWGNTFYSAGYGYFAVDKYSDDQWFHIRINFNCSSDKYDLYLDGLKVIDQANFYYTENYVDHIWFASSNGRNGTYYIDALSFSWDTNYTIGANMYEGLLLSYENSTVLDWQGYSLDDQSTKTIVGNTTIPMPENGVHTIQIFANDTLGFMYSSQIRYFTIQYFPIDIITPENKTYTEPMSGYYPATYGFENDMDNSMPKEWLNNSRINSEVKVINGIAGHNKILYCYSSSSSDSKINLYNYVEPQVTGTIEFWLYKSSIYDWGPAWIQFFGGGGRLTHIIVDGGNRESIRISIGSNNTDIDVNYFDDIWMHYRFAFNCTSDTFSLWVDGAQYLDNVDFEDFRDITYFNQTSFSSFDVGNPVLYYVDAVGYSWDPNYHIGDNLYEGLLVSYESKTMLDWQGYSLDGQPAKTILGNTTIPMSGDGLHTIQVIGRNSIGTKFYSNIRYFTISTISDITDPEITINSPIYFDLFGSSAPFFNITIIELNLDAIWYTLDAGMINITITEPTGFIDQIEWDKFGNGTDTIRFYANDTASNVGWEEVIVRKDILPPDITITSPVSNYLFGSNVPSFDLIIVESNLDSRWYTLDGGITLIPISGSTGTIEQTEWDKFGNGTVTIQFYANDSVGNSGWEQVTVRKDVLPPEITINFPSETLVFTESAPSFALTINEGNLNEIWYTLDDGLINRTCGTSGQIIQAYWNALPPGDYTLRFYATDTLGHEGFAEVIVRKRESPAIPSYNMIILSLIMIFGLISISWEIKKRIM